MQRGRHDNAMARRDIAQVTLDCDVYMLDTQTWLWSKLNKEQEAPGETCPPARYMHSVAVDEAGQRLFVFGGLALSSSPDNPVVLNDVWVFNVTDGMWSKLPIAVTGIGPTGRFDHASVIKDNRLHVLYGRVNTLEYSEDVIWSLDLATLRWRNVTVHDRQYPQPRGGMSAVVVELPGDLGPPSGLMVFAGELELSSSLGAAFKDAWALGIADVGLEALEAYFFFQSVSQFPESRTESAAAHLQRRGMWLIHGGLSEGRGLLDDTWVLAFNATVDSSNPIWTREIDVNADKSEVPKPDARSGHTLFGIAPSPASHLPTDDYVIMQGGRSSLSGFEPLDDVWLFNVTATSWTQVIAAPNSPVPPRRSFHGGVGLGPGRFLIYGGQQRHQGDTHHSQPSDDVWVCTLAHNLSACSWSAITTQHMREVGSDQMARQTARRASSAAAAQLEPVPRSSGAPARSHHVSQALDCNTYACRGLSGDVDSKQLVIFGGLLSDPFGGPATERADRLLQYDQQNTDGATGLHLGDDTWVMSVDSATSVGQWLKVSTVCEVSCLGNPWYLGTYS